MKLSKELLTSYLRKNNNFNTGSLFGWNKNLYKDIMDLLKVYKFKIEFEKIYYNGEGI